MQTRSHRTVLVAGIAALTLASALLAAGCGSSISRSSFVQRADAICTTANAQVNRVKAPKLTGVTTAQGATALATYLGELVTFSQGVLNKLKALPQPSSDQSLLQRYYTALQQGINGYRSLSSALAKQDAQGIATARQALAVNPAGTLAKEYGFRVCSVNGA